MKKNDFEPLKKQDVMNVENQIDSDFDSSNLPGDNVSSSRWILCTVGEDVHRLHLHELSKVWQQESSRDKRAKFIGMLDVYKYSLRHALDLCDKKLLPSNQACSFKVGAENYTTASDLLLKSAHDFAIATRVFSSYHAGITNLFINKSTGKIKPSSNDIISDYSSLELLLGADRDEFSPVVLLATIFGGDGLDLPSIDSVAFWSDEIKQIVKNVKIRHGRLRYKFINKLSISLYDNLNVDTKYLPTEWIFPWADARSAQEYYAALQATCLYHLISIHFGAIKLNAGGVGVNQICLRLDVKNLNDNLAMISGLSIESVSQITKALTYGNGTRTPDPALQPIIPLENSDVAIPCILILSSNWARNMLSLHTRVSPRTFDKNSECFEVKMTDELKLVIPNHFNPRFNIFIPTQEGPEEIDLLLIDEKSKSILIGELRWMLQPGDVREVINRKKVVNEKVAQVSRKVTAAKDSINKVLNYLGLSQEGVWDISGIVIIDGFGGSPSGQPKEIPVVPKDIFTSGLQLSPSLEHLHAVFTTSLWRPKQGTDYTRGLGETTLCGVPFLVPGINIGSTSYIKKSLPDYLSNAFKMTISELQSTPWELKV